MKNLTIITIIILISISMMNSQNSRVSWSSFNMGYTSSSSTNTMVKSIVGQSCVGSMKFGNNFVESGFLVDTLFRSMIVDVKNQEQLPTFYSLWQNYPNPINPKTTIHFELPKESYVTLKVYNMLGQEVLTLLEEKKPAGRYDITIDGTSLASSAYVYRLVAGDFVAVKKFILLK